MSKAAASTARFTEAPSLEHAVQPSADDDTNEKEKRDRDVGNTATAVAAATSTSGDQPFCHLNNDGKLKKEITTVVEPNVLSSSTGERVMVYEEGAAMDY